MDAGNDLEIGLGNQEVLRCDVRRGVFLTLVAG